MLDKNNMERDGTFFMNEWRVWQFFSHKTTIKPYKNFPKQPYQGYGYQLKSKPQIEKQSFIQSCWTSGTSSGCLPHLCQRLPPPPTSPQTPWLFHRAMAGHDHERQSGQTGLTQSAVEGGHPTLRCTVGASSKPNRKWMDTSFSNLSLRP